VPEDPAGPSAAEQRGNNFKGPKELCLKVTAIIRPWLSYVPYSLDSGYRGTSLIRNTPNVGPYMYSKPMPRTLR
jgi:hypothetical protein